MASDTRCSAALIAWKSLPWKQGEPETAAQRPSRYERIRATAAARGIPLPAILTFCGVVVAIYLAGKIAYRMLDILLMIAVAGFLA